MLPVKLSDELQAEKWKKIEAPLLKDKARKPSGIAEKLTALAAAHAKCDLDVFDLAQAQNPTDAETQLAGLRKQGAAAIKNLLDAARELSDTLGRWLSANKKDAVLKEAVAAALKLDQKTVALIAKADGALRETEAALVKIKDQAAKAPKVLEDAANPLYKLVRSKAIAGLRAVVAPKPKAPPMRFLMMVGKTQALPYLATTVGASQRAPLLSLLGEDGQGAKAVVGTLVFEAKVYTFVCDTAVSGAAKKLQAGLQRLTKSKLKVCLRGPDGAQDEADGGSGADLPAEEPLEQAELEPGPAMPGVGEGLAEPVDEAEAVERVEARRRDSEVKRGRLKQAIDLVVGKDPVDLVMLRKLAEEEFARAKALDDELKQAKAAGLPIAPPPARVNFDDNQSPGASEWVPKVCADAFRKYTWFDLKDLRKSGAVVDVPGVKTQNRITDEVMWKLYQYRRREVDKLIAGLHGLYKGLLFKSVGSEDIESDLDITVASPAPGDDVKAMRQFNAAIKAKFGRPPGRVFDVNLYARDYRAIKDNITKHREGVAPVDESIAEPEGEIAKMSAIDQDVATLMKQRRFLDADTYDALWKQLLAGIPDDAEHEKDRADLKQRFEEAEAVYLLTAQDKVQSIIDNVQKNAAKLSDAQKAVFDRATLRFATALSRGDDAATQRLLPELLDLLEEEFPDQVMDATDEIYAERMAQLREDQIRVAEIEAQRKGHTQEGADCDTVHPGQTHQKWDEGFQALKARIKQALFTNIVFANEAYVSQGAIGHIVDGSQAATPEAKKKVLDGLQPLQLLNSTNEQLADFYKDMKHMEHAERAAKTAVERRRAAGEAFVHASKYLSRTLDGAAMLEQKYPKDPAALKILTDPPYPLCRRAGVASAAELRDKVEAMLVRLRKSSALPGAAKAELAVADVQAMFQVNSVDGLRKLIAQFSVDFNGRVRQLKDFREAQKVDKATERQYFHPTERPARQ